MSEGRTMIISVKLDESTIRKIDTIVSMGHFRSRSELIRTAIERKLSSLGFKVTPSIKRGISRRAAK